MNKLKHAVLVTSVALGSLGSGSAVAVSPMDAYLDPSYPTVSKTDLLQELKNYINAEDANEQRADKAYANCKPTGTGAVTVTQTETHQATPPSGKLDGLSPQELAAKAMQGNTEAMAALQQLGNKAVLKQHGIQPPADEQKIRESVQAKANSKTTAALQVALSAALDNSLDPTAAAACEQKAAKEDTSANSRFVFSNTSEAGGAIQMLGTIDPQDPRHKKRITGVHFDSGLPAGWVNVVDAPVGSLYTDPNRPEVTVPVLKVDEAARFLKHPGSYTNWISTQKF